MPTLGCVVGFCYYFYTTTFILIILSCYFFKLCFIPVKIECTCKKYAKDNECDVDTGKCTCKENACGDECDKPCDEFCPNPECLDPKKCIKPILGKFLFINYLILPEFFLKKT